MKNRWRVGLLTGGGDSSGINAFIRSVCMGVWEKEGEVVGLRNGWAGLVEGNASTLTPEDVDRITMQPGTILGTSRTNVVKAGLMDEVLKNVEELGLTHLVAVGGDDTLGVASHLAELCPIPILGVPQTIDNDIAETELCLGFTTAVQRGIDAIHDMIPSNRAHGMPMLVEVMGRNSGWLALHIAAGVEADFVAIPEIPWSIDELVETYRAAGPAFLAVIAEGVQNERVTVSRTPVDAFGNPALAGVAYQIAAAFAEQTGTRPRVQVTGYLLRGGPPSVADLHLAWRFASAVLNGLEEGVTGCMVAWRNQGTEYVPLDTVRGRQRHVPPELSRELTRFIGVPGLSAAKAL